MYRAADATPAGLPQESGIDWLAAIARLDECDGYALLVVDPQTGATDVHGPYEGLGAVTAADELRRSLDAEDLDDVDVRVVRMHLAEESRPSPASRTAPHTTG